MSDQKFDIFYDKDFLKDTDRLPHESQNKLAELLEILREDPFDPKMHTKPLAAPLQGMFSFCITRDWRVGFKFKSDNIIHLLAADRRDTIYKRLKRKTSLL